MSKYSACIEIMICALLQVQEAVKCRVVDRQEDTNGDSGGSFQNGHAQLMVCSAICLFLPFRKVLFNIILVKFGMM